MNDIIFSGPSAAITSLGGSGLSAGAQAFLDSFRMASLVEGMSFAQVQTNAAAPNISVGTGTGVDVGGRF